MKITTPGGELRFVMNSTEVSFCICIDRYKPASSLVLIFVRGNDHVNKHRTNPRSSISLVGSKTAYFESGVTLEHFALSEELLAETIICRIARKVCQRNSVVGKAEISYDISSGFVLQHITGSKADAIIQWGIREYEVIQVFVPTVKSRNYIICAKAPKLEHIPVHHFKTSS